MHQSSTTTPTKPDTSIVKNFNTNKPISVHKMDVSTISGNPNKNCPIHNKPHPLKKCRAFRNKLFSDRKAFFKEKGICFKCCSLISYLAKDCESSVKCSECDSTNHDAAMHPGPSPQTMSRLLLCNKRTAGREKIILTRLLLEQAAQKFVVQVMLKDLPCKDIP